MKVESKLFKGETKANPLDTVSIKLIKLLPLANVKEFELATAQKMLGCGYPTIVKIIDKLIENGVIEQFGNVYTDSVFRVVQKKEFKSFVKN